MCTRTATAQRHKGGNRWSCMVFGGRSGRWRHPLGCLFEVRIRLGQGRGEGDYLPIAGWTSNPESGPARKTRDMYDFDRPSERRYGDAISIPVHLYHYFTTTATSNTDSPYESSTDQRTDTPKKPMVTMGRRVACGPAILEVPCHCVVEWESATRRGSGNPVISSLARLRGGSWSEY